MSLTIQDCASQTAADLRERRRQKILQNAEQRLVTILSGPEGNEKRQAPSIEGMFGNENHQDGDPKQPAVDSPLDITRQEIHFVAPKYCELVDRNRFWIMVVLGMILRFAVQLGFLDHVFVAFTAIFLGWELLVAIPQKRLLTKYPKHGYTVNMLLISGLNERMVVWLGLALDLIWEFGIDLCLTTFAFICTHLLIMLANTIASSPCCSSNAK